MLYIIINISKIIYNNLSNIKKIIFGIKNRLKKLLAINKKFWMLIICQFL